MRASPSDSEPSITIQVIRASVEISLAGDIDRPNKVADDTNVERTRSSSHSTMPRASGVTWDQRAKPDRLFLATQLD